MKKRFFNSTVTRMGFTLIELLIVVAIIGILVSLSFPVISRVRTSARRTAAQVDIRSIGTAVDQYFATYRKLPIPDENHSDDKLVIDSDEEELAIKVLAALQGSNAFDLNPRELVLLQLQEGRPHGHFMDPWSRGVSVLDDSDNMIYELIFDSNLDGVLSCAEIDTRLTGRNIENRLFYGRSPGPNRVIEESVGAKDFDDVYTSEIQAIFKHLLN